MRRNVKITLDVNGPPQLLPTMLVSIIDANGLTFASRQFGGATVRGRVETSADLEFNAPQGQLFAKLELPNGTNQSKAVPLEGRSKAAVRFPVGHESPAETMAWSTSRLRFDRSAQSLKDQPGMRQAWIQRWALKDGGWTQVRSDQGTIQSRETALQLDLPPLPYPGALVVETGELVPHVLALPKDVRLMALLTTTRYSADQRRTRVVIGGYGSRAEGLMDFLRKGAMDAAGQIADEARHYLYEKRADPLGATAAAYFLLRVRDWERMPAEWLNNLANWNPELPDARLIEACARIQRGVPKAQAARIAAKSIWEAFRAGYPLFWEARDVLEELYTWCEGTEWLQPAQREFIRTLLMVAKPAGLTFGFSGLVPWAPGARDVLLANPPYRGRLPTGAAKKSVTRARTNDSLTIDFATSLSLPGLGGDPVTRSRPYGDAANTLFLQDHL